MSDIAAVVIGRNEGARLIACLDSLSDQVARIIYVDSGSTDHSVAEARNLGCDIVELPPDQPFTAARARNAGFAALEADNLPDFVHFFDGDCRVEPGWIAKAKAHLESDDKLGLVTGWRSEIHREQSIYNALCDFEWHRPAGEIAACGGDMAVRSSAFIAAGRFNADVIAAEDDEFCVRLAKAGWKLWRLPEQMTHHDANMLHFGQWWQRAVRSGHGFAQVGALHPSYFKPERARVVLFGGILPALAVMGLFVTGWFSLMILALYGISYLRTARGLSAEGLSVPEAQRHAMLLTLSKFPNIIGMWIYRWRRLRGASMRIIEYK